jgi:putative chitinase
MNLDKLKGHVPDSVLSQIPQVMEKFQINTPLRLCHFLAQCAHESGNFKAVNENLNYGPVALLKTFPKYFPEGFGIDEYARKPEKIANLVYGNRMGNGPETSGDGYRYRGRGYIQLTGKTNYQAFDKFVDEDVTTNPDLVATKYPLLSAAWFWNSRTLNSLADRGSTDMDVTAITRKVNGGTHGLDDRLAKFKKFYEILK